MTHPVGDSAIPPNLSPSAEASYDENALNDLAEQMQKDLADGNMQAVKQDLDAMQPFLADLTSMSQKGELSSDTANLLDMANSLYQKMDNMIEQDTPQNASILGAMLKTMLQIPPTGGPAPTPGLSPDAEALLDANTAEALMQQLQTDMANGNATAMQADLDAMGPYMSDLNALAQEGKLPSDVSELSEQAYSQWQQMDQEFEQVTPQKVAIFQASLQTIMGLLPPQR